MSGTDHRQQTAAIETRQPVIVLVEPQLGENIGAAARAMLNFSLTDLRIVNPRAGWPNYQAINTASGAESVIHAATLFASFDDAVADLTYLVATTARVRDMVKPVETPRGAASRLHEVCARGETCGVLFGRERSGLDNDQVARAGSLLIVPPNPG